MKLLSGDVMLKKTITVLILLAIIQLVWAIDPVITIMYL